MIEKSFSPFITVDHVLSSKSRQLDSCWQSLTVRKNDRTYSLHGFVWISLSNQNKSHWSWIGQIGVVYLSKRFHCCVKKVNFIKSESNFVKYLTCLLVSLGFDAHRISNLVPNLNIFLFVCDLCSTLQYRCGLCRLFC